MKASTLHGFDFHINNEKKSYTLVCRGVTGLRMSRKFPDLESKLWRGVMWSASYYIGTAGDVSAETIERYIKEQRTE